MAWIDTNWQQDDDINGGFPYPIDTNAAIPFDYGGVYTVWKFSPYINDGFPYIVPINEKHPVSTPKKIPPLIVFDAHETEFKTNGLRILSPTVATFEKELNQAGDIFVEHPIDPDGDWTALRLGNIILAPVFFRGEYKPQPFRIHKTVKKRNGTDATIAVYARHIFYDLSYCVLQDVRPTEKNGQDALEWIFANVYAASGTQEPATLFTAFSDIETESTSQYQWKTVTAALIGEDNSVLERWGGELYTDGYYFSINTTMENSKSNAFNLRYRTDMTAITETVDNTNTFSHLIATDNNGNFATASVPLWYSGLPFNKVLHASFSYSEKTPETAAQFGKDFDTYMHMIQELDVSYDVTFADLPNLAEYDGFKGLATHEVGDSGTIHDDGLQIFTAQRIVKKKVDLLKNETISCTLGNMKRSISRKQPFSNTVSTGQSAVDKQLAALEGTTIGTSISQLERYAISILEGYSISELEGN